MQVADLAFNQRWVVCRQSTCKYFGETRTVSLPIVAPGAFIDSMILCECGFAPNIVAIPELVK